MNVLRRGFDGNKVEFERAKQLFPDLAKRRRRCVVSAGILAIIVVACLVAAVFLELAPLGGIAGILFLGMLLCWRWMCDDNEHLFSAYRNYQLRRRKRKKVGGK